MDDKDPLIDEMARVIAEAYAPAVDATAPYAKVMARMAAKAVFDAMFSTIPAPPNQAEKKEKVIALAHKALADHNQERKEAEKQATIPYPPGFLDRIKAAEKATDEWLAKLEK